MTKSKSIMLNAIIKKVTSANVSTKKLQQIADILGINTVKSQIQKDIESDYLQKIKEEQLLDNESDYLQQIKAEHLLDEIELAKDKALLKSLSKKTPKPTTKKTAVQLPKEKPKQQLTWIEHVKKYVKDNNVSYRDALKLASATYVKKKQTTKPTVKKAEKKEKLIKEYHCQFCKYQSTDKSNFNRHMKKHTDKKKLLLGLAKSRGLIRTHKTRAEKSKNKAIREESQKILTQALETERIVTDTLKKLEAGTLKASTTKSVSKKKKAATVSKTVPKYAEDLIKRMNQSYEENSGEKLGLTKDKVTEFKRDGDNIIMRVKDLVVDDGEQIDSVEMDYDSKMDGYEVALMQDEEIRGEIKSLEYDQFFIY